MNNTLSLIFLTLVFSSALSHVSAQEDLYFDQQLIDLPLDADLGLNPEAWSETHEVAGKSCRQLLKGKKGTVNIPVWWQDNLRPDRSANALAKIVFQDTSNTPIRVQLFAALPGEIEIHRIGGLGDMQWKTALVPIPWDQIIRFKDAQHTAMSFLAPQDHDVPMHSIQIRTGNAAQDELRWAAETRGWVSRAQAEKRAQAILPAAQTAFIPEQFKNQAAFIYTRSMVNLIYPNSAPQEVETINQLELTLAQNEIEGLQFAVYAATAPLENLSLRCEALVSEDGSSFDGVIELFTTEYAVVRASGDTYTIYPQRLWPNHELSLGAQMSQSYWLNIESLRGKTKAGIYSGKIDIQNNGKNIGSAQLKVHVLPIDLLSMTEAGLHLGGCTPQFIPAHELEELVRHNHNSINLWYSGTWADRPKRISATEFEIEFWRWDDFMSHAKAAGIDNFVYFLGGDPYGYPDTMQMERDLYRFIHADSDDLDESRTAWLKSAWNADGKVAPEIRDLYKEWIKQFYTHAAEYHWPEPIITPFDEPAKWAQEKWARGKQYRWLNQNGTYSFAVRRNNQVEQFLADLKTKGLEAEYICDAGAGPWIKTHFKDCVEIIRQAYPQARIYGSIHHAETGLPFLSDVDVFCTNAIHEDLALGDKVRAAENTTFWQYSGTNDKRPPVVPWFTFGFYFGAFDSRGSLVWAYNWGDRFDTANDGGQWMYAWTTPYSIVRTPYLEGLREGFDDRRYIETLKKIARETGHEQEATELLDTIFKEVIGARNDKGQDTVNNFFAQSDDPEKLSKYRQLIAQKILQLQLHP